MIEVDELNLSVTNSPFTEGQATKLMNYYRHLPQNKKYG